MLNGFVFQYIEQFTFIAIFIFLILCGLGFPVPEEVLLVISGYIAYKGLTSPYLMGAADFLGVLGGDLILFFIGKRWSIGRKDHRFIKKFIGDIGLEKVKTFYTRHGNKTIFIARFISGLRVAVFLSAGVMNIKTDKFLFIDALGAIISVPLWVGAGFIMGSNIDKVLRYTRDFEYLFIILVPFIIAGVVVVFLHLRKKT